MTWCWRTVDQKSKIT